MYIGKLNERLKNRKTEIYKLGTGEVPEKKLNGDPFASEELCVEWKVLLETGVELHFSWEGRYLINDVVLTLGSACTPTEIRVYSPDRKTMLCRYTAESGKMIESREITLAVEAELDGFIVEIDHEFSSIVIKNVEVYGADTEGIQLFPEPVSVKAAEGTISIDRLKSYSADGEIARGAAEVLCEKWEEKCGAELEESDRGMIRLVEDSDVAENGYRLSVDENGAEICASDLRGMIYGAEVLMKLIDGDNIPFVV